MAKDIELVENSQNQDTKYMYLKHFLKPKGIDQKPLICPLPVLPVVCPEVPDVCPRVAGVCLRALGVCPGALADWYLCD